MKKDNMIDFSNKRVLTTAEAMAYLSIKSRGNFQRNYVEKYNLQNVSNDEWNRYDIRDLDKILDEKKNKIAS